MDSSLRLFLCQFVGVVLAALVPVVLVTFLSIPYILGGHPGEAPAVVVANTQHST